MVLDLVKGVALLLSLSLLQGFVVRLLHRWRMAEEVVSGLLFGAICIVGMAIPIEFSEGVIFDARTAVIAIASLFSGAVTGGIATVLAVAYRLWLGGAGAPVGVATILTALAFGLAFRAAWQRGRIRRDPVRLIVFGALLHVACLGWFLLLPQETIGRLFSELALPYVTILAAATAILGVLVQDSLDRLRAAATLHRSERRLKTLLDAAEVPFLTADFTDLVVALDRLRAEGVTDLAAHLRRHPDERLTLWMQMRVFDANPAALRLFEAPDLATYLLRLPDVVRPETVEAFGVFLENLWLGRPSFRATTVFSTLEGNLRHVVLSQPMPVEPYDPRNVPICVLDVTDLTAAHEELLRQNTELERFNGELRAFAHAAAHDLREPLRNVISHTTLLERRLGPRLEGEEREILAFVRDGALRMDDLVRDLLTFAEVGRAGATATPQDMEAVLAAVIHDLRHPIAETGAVIDHPAPLPMVRGHRIDLERLLLALIGNALKYRAPDRAPRVEVTATPAVLEDGAPAWRFSVRDNGIGIEPGHGFEDRIFGLFQRLHGRDAYGGGTGIGLALCRKIVDRHGGRIWVTSTPGEGSTFHFVLPAAETAETVGA